MTLDETVVLLFASTMTVATAWAAWVSKTLIAILTVMRGTETDVAALQATTEDHETRIRGLEAM